MKKRKFEFTKEMADKMKAGNRRRIAIEEGVPTFKNVTHKSPKDYNRREAKKIVIIED